MDKYTGKIWDVLKSRRFVSSAVYAIVALVAVFVPQFQREQDTIINFVTPIVIALISGYTIQDVFVLIAGGKPIPQPEETTEA